MHRNTDGARLIGNRTRNRLPDPPGCIGREFVAAAIFKLIDRLHQADIAFLNKIEELQPAIGVFFGNRNHETQIRLDHFLLGLTGFALALLYHMNDLAEFGNFQPGLGSEIVNLLPNFADHVLFFGDKLFPAARAELGNAQQPLRIKFRALIIAQEVFAADAMALSQPHQAAFKADQPLIDIIKLLDQRLDTVGVERQRFHICDDLVFELLIFTLLRGRQRVVLQLRLDVLLLQSAQLFIGRSDAVEGFKHLRLQFRFHSRKRDIVLEIVVVEFAFRNGRLFPFSERLRLGTLNRNAHNAFDLRNIFSLRAGIGRLKINNIAQQNLGFDQFIAPDDDGLEGQRIFAQARNHRLAASLDALGNRNFAFARQKLHRAHFAQVHAHRIICAIGRLFGRGRGWQRRAGCFDQIGAGLFFLFALGLFLGRFGFGLFLLDNIDAHIIEHREHVFNLVGGHFLRRKHFVDFFMGHKAALFGELDHPLDGLIRKIQQRTIGGRRVANFAVAFVRRLGRHGSYAPHTSMSRSCKRGRPVPKAQKGARVHRGRTALNAQKVRSAKTDCPPLTY